jgi:hypothetical protein
MATQDIRLDLEENKNVDDITDITGTTPVELSKGTVLDSDRTKRQLSARHIQM